MERTEAEGGKPFEAATVKTKFDLRGNGKIALPMVICNTPDGFEVKWIDLTLKGLHWGNRLEHNTSQTSAQVQAVVEKEYLPVTYITDKLLKKSSKDGGTTYIGVAKPEGLPEDTKVFTISSLKDLIPA